MNKLEPRTHAVAERFLRVSALLETARQIQWEAAPIPKPREDTTSRSIGGYGNPTLDITLDPRRLEVREAVKIAERALAVAEEGLEHAQARLASAVDAWEGTE